MRKEKITIIVTTLSILWFLTGCVERGLPVLPGESGYSHGWSSSEEEENIDISDLDKNLTDFLTDMTERFLEKEHAFT